MMNSEESHNLNKIAKDNHTEMGERIEKTHWSILDIVQNTRVGNEYLRQITDLLKEQVAVSKEILSKLRDIGGKIK